MNPKVNLHLLVLAKQRELKPRRRRGQWNEVAKKKNTNLRSFKLYRVFLDLLNLSNVGDFSWSWILKDFIHVQKEKGEFVVVCPRHP